MIGVQYNIMTFIYFFLLVALLGNSIFVVLMRNPINAILYLIGAFLTSGFLLLFFNLEFFAILFIAIYIGAIAVFFLFVVMMFNIPVKSEEFSFLYAFSALFIFCFFLYFMVCLAPALYSYANIVLPVFPLQTCGLRDLSLLLFKKYYLYILLVGVYFFILLVGISMMYRH
jgi:NADH-quinone oxidoreductase subunit J